MVMTRLSKKGEGMAVLKENGTGNNLEDRRRVV
jgi:hypothetical protein